jgi:hypothetical protein
VLTDNHLLAFKASSLPGTEPADAHHLLHEHGDVFRAQLVAAHWLESYLKSRKTRKDETAWPRRSNDERDAGYEAAVQDIVAHLRHGDFLPGGSLYEDEQAHG